MTTFFVGTKKQAQDSIRDEALRCGQYYVNAGWLGGMLTNFKTIQQRIERLKQLEEMEQSGLFEVLPKKEVIKLRGEKEKLGKFLGGIKEMRKLPGVLFVVDSRKERNAILEARKLGIPVVAIVDTNCDPDEVDYVIPGNDDAIRAVKLIASKIADAVMEANQGEQLSTGDESGEDKSLETGAADEAGEALIAETGTEAAAKIEPEAVKEAAAETEEKAVAEKAAEPQQKPQQKLHRGRNRS